MERRALTPLVEHDELHVFELGAVVGVVAEAHQLRRGGRVLLLHLGRHEEGGGGRQLQHARLDGLREEEPVEQRHRQAQRLQVEPELGHRKSLLDLMFDIILLEEIRQQFIHVSFKKQAPKPNIFSAWMHPWRLTEQIHLRTPSRI